MGVLTRSVTLCVVAVALAFGNAWHAEAEGASAPQLTAAFLLNFVKFTTWPEGALPADSPLTVCVLDNDRVADELSALARTTKVVGRGVAVRRVTLQSSLQQCQVLYGGDVDNRRTGPLLDATSGHPILTVGASSDFAERGGVANFFVDNGRMRFAVNPKAAERSHLRISSRLLSLARIVHHAGP